MTTRSGDRGTVAAWWGRYGRDLTTAVAVGIAAFSVYLVVDESKTRVNETCLRFEREEAVAVRRLTTTYGYLLSLPPGAKDELLNKTIIAGLDRTEQDARASLAPSYCNKLHVGLPEPAKPKKFPERPTALR